MCRARGKQLPSLAYEDAMTFAGNPWQQKRSELIRLQKLYGRGRWRKMKGVALIRLRSGRVRKAELHWYEAHGIGKKEFKRKRYLD